MKTILLTCGETSGDYHASLVVSQLKKLNSYRVMAMGGERLKQAGAEILYSIDDYAFMGFAEVLRGLPRILSLEREIKSLLKSGEVDLFMPVDYPGMNLRLARYAHKKGVPVLYYISPQVWAWGGNRVKKMKGNIDLMAVILPFEEEIYRSEGIPVEFVGHPMLEEIPHPGGALESPGEREETEILLFPGSRKQEVERMLPVILEAASIIMDQLDRVKFRIGLAPLIEQEDIKLPQKLENRVEITPRGVEGLNRADFVIAVSGTVTLQAAISGTPMIVIYRTSPITYFIGKMLVRIPRIAMPNVLAGRMVVPELVQGDARPEVLAARTVEILRDHQGYKNVSAELLELRKTLKGKGGAGRVAERIAELTGE